MAKLSFEEWLKKVDAILIAKCGMSLYDLPDCSYSLWYESGISAESAAKRALRHAAD